MKYRAYDMEQSLVSGICASADEAYAQMQGSNFCNVLLDRVPESIAEFIELCKNSAAMTDIIVSGEWEDHSGYHQVGAIMIEKDSSLDESTAKKVERFLSTEVSRIYSLELQATEAGRPENVLESFAL